MEIRVCERCGEALAPRARRDAQYCSGACRMAALRTRRADAAASVPHELTSKDRWVRYSPRKIPLQATGRDVASSTDPSTWSSFAEASASTRGVGLGFVLDGDGIVCIDLDHCLTRGQLAPWAQRIVAAAGATYVEVSPSGTGVHIWGRAELASGRVVHVPGGGKAEVYPSGRYITVTSRPFGDTPSVLGDLTALVGELIS